MVVVLVVVVFVACFEVPLGPVSLTCLRDMWWVRVCLTDFFITWSCAWLELQVPVGTLLVRAGLGTHSQMPLLLSAT